jgi:GcrA cell cycle regulator
MTVPMRSEPFIPAAQPGNEERPRKLANGNFVTTLELSSNTCRWPIGDPTQADFHYCGQRPESGRAYCDTHERRSYQGPARRAVSR